MTQLGVHLDLRANDAAVKKEAEISTVIRTEKSMWVPFSGFDEQI